MNKLKNQDISILTDRLFLKVFQEKDYLDFFELMSNDEIGKYLPLGRGMTDKECKKYFNKIIFDNHSNIVGMFSIFKKNDGKYIGYCGIKKIPVIMELEIIYALKKQYWGKGYCTEAVEAVLESSRQDLNIKKILGVSKPENQKSIELLKRLEFSDFGVKEIFGNSFRYFEKVIL